MERAGSAANLAWHAYEYQKSTQTDEVSISGARSPPPSTSEQDTGHVTTSARHSSDEDGEKNGNMMLLIATVVIGLLVAVVFVYKNRGPSVDIPHEEQEHILVL